jgi:acetylornithine deacetylase
MRTTASERQRLFAAVQRRRLLDTATRLIAAQSWTGAARPALDCLAEILCDDGIAVERPTGGYAAAPAVLARLTGKKPGKTLQFNGHLDTVHLPFVPPRVEGDRLRGSGSSDMKAGTAAAVEALRAVRDADALQAGEILFTAHDLHEAPWGDGRQLNQLIAEGLHGDAVLIPEYLNEVLPVIGRGALTWKAHIRRPGPAVHEVMRPDEPNVIAVGAELVQRLLKIDLELAQRRDRLAGPESLFIGQIHSGEIYNQYPHECFLEGTRRWLPATKRADVELQLSQTTEALARETDTAIAIDLFPIRDAFLLDQNDSFVDLFQEAHQALTGRTLPLGAKPFCDDANSFWSIARIPAITHGPMAGGAHTLEEWVSIDDLLRVARLYALTALEFCEQ